MNNIRHSVVAILYGNCVSEPFSQNIHGDTNINPGFPATYNRSLHDIESFNG